MAKFNETDAGLKSFFDKAYAYAVFSKIGKGGLGVGGAHGTGVVFKGGKAVGKSKMTQLTFGFQAGGQAYKQIIFFQNQKAYDAFVGTNYYWPREATRSRCLQNDSLRLRLWRLMWFQSVYMCTFSLRLYWPVLASTQPLIKS